MNFDRIDLETARRLTIQRLESLERAGVTHLPRPPRVAPAIGLRRSEAALAGRSTAEAGATAGPPSAAELSRTTPSHKEAGTMPELNAGAAAAPDASPEQRQAALQVISREVAACVRCRALAATRTQTVFGVGNPCARLCFLGEAPGADEDRQGEPFVGRAGQLLNKIIEACTMRREDVYILNTLKCRPPDNRNPSADELANCRGFLDRQLEIIRPEFICCLGAVAAKALLATEAPIGKLRKRFFEHQGAQVICTYHPAYLLRNPAAKKDVWEDMQMLLRAMGIELPGAKK